VSDDDPPVAADHGMPGRPNSARMRLGRHHDNDPATSSAQLAPDLLHLLPCVLHPAIEDPDGAPGNPELLEQVAVRPLFALRTPAKLGQCGLLGWIPRAEEPHLRRQAPAMDRCRLLCAERKGAGEHDDCICWLERVGHDEPVAHPPDTERTRDAESQHDREERTPPAQPSPSPRLPITQSFGPRLSHVPRKVIQNDRAISLRSSQNDCLRM
jgi:hypothetical protein